MLRDTQIASPVQIPLFFSKNSDYLANNETKKDNLHWSHLA
jgi:hypothetical protein